MINTIQELKLKIEQTEKEIVSVAESLVRARETDNQVFLNLYQHLMSRYQGKLEGLQEALEVCKSAEVPPQSKPVLCWLTDGEDISRSAYLTPLELEDEQMKAYDASGGNVWWVVSEKEPNLPRSYGFQHIPRKEW